MGREHVDLVQNDWEAEEQRVVARVFRNGELVVKDDAGTWEQMLRDGMGDRWHRPDALDVLSTVFDGGYVFATRPHDEDSCPYAGGVLKMSRRGSATLPAKPR